MNFINSTSNQSIKHLCRLVQSSKFRRENGEFLLEGLRLCLDCLMNTKIEAKSVFFTQNAYSKYKDQLAPLISDEFCTIISDSVCAKISETENSQGVFVLCKIPKQSTELSLKIGQKILALENVQNPDNFGAICRSAEALGIDFIVISGGVDIYNPKALRSAMGSSLRMNIAKIDDFSAFISQCKQVGLPVYSTVPSSDATFITDVDFSSGAVCIIGNEGNGVSDAVLESTCHITIPMLGKAESLNAATAAAITIWEMVR